jgi:predicted RNA-binding Zn-ribbon protein involved in translation (DUF1610 family)
MSVPLQALAQQVLCPKCGASFSGAEGLEQVPQAEATLPSPQSSILPALGWILVVGLFVSALVFLVAASRASRRAMDLRVERLGSASPGEESSLLLDEFLGISMAVWLVTCVVIYTSANAILASWAAEDALSRECRAAAVWGIAVLFTSVLGLLFYLVSRPRGRLVLCARCRKTRLDYALRCPHCGLSAIAA